MINDLMQILIFVIILIILHEFGHVIAAKILKLEIQKIGFKIKPFPSFFVAVKWPTKEIEKYIYLFSGTFVTVILFITAFIFNFGDNKYLYSAFIIQLINETNPLYSDFTIAIVNKQIKNYENFKKSHADYYKEQFSKYLFSTKWYIHFVLWTLIIFLLFNLKKKFL